MTFFLPLLFLLLPNVSAAKKDEYKQWIEEEVNLIITDAEKAEYKKLKKDEDREQFVKLFWARRDPTPATERNEFREEYYQRLEYVKDAFYFGYKTGTRTDMGKVYLYFGRPARVFRQDPRVEIWVYPTQSWMNIPKETFSFIFSSVDTSWSNEERTKDLQTQQDSAGFSLNVEKTDSRVLQVFYGYPKHILLYPDLKKLPEYKKAISFSSESFEGKLIQQRNSSLEDIGPIRFEKTIVYVKAANLSSYVTFLVKIDPGEKRKAFEKKVIWFGKLESESYSSDFREEKVPSEEKESLVYQFGFPALPGEYTLFLGFYTQDKETYSLQKDTLEVPNFWGQELTLSSLIASAQIQETQAAAKKAEFDVFSFGHYLLKPPSNQEYTHSEILNVFYYIYNPTVDANQTCSILSEFTLKKGEKTFKMTPQKKQQIVKEGEVLLEGTRIPLSALPGPGEYELTVKVTDELTQKTASQRLVFSVL